MFLKNYVGILLKHFVLFIVEIDVIEKFVNFIRIRNKIESKNRRNGDTLYWAFETSCILNGYNQQMISR